MAQVTTIRILIAGLAALVDRSPGHMEVLLPKVDSQHWLEEHNLYIPDHDVLLGYLGSQRVDGNCEAIEPGLGGGDGQTCWQKLEGMRISFEIPDLLAGQDVWGLKVKPPEDMNVRGRRFMGLGGPRRLPRDPEAAKDFSWVAEMSRIARAAPSRTAAGETRVCRHDLEAQTDLQYTRRYACRLAGYFDRAEKRYVVPVYRFRSSVASGEETSYRQALAIATMVEIELDEAVPDLSVCLEPLTDGGTPAEKDCRLRLRPDINGVVELALTQQVLNQNALLHAIKRALGMTREGVDDHFRVYHYLGTGTGTVPFEDGRSVSFSQEELDEEVCSSSFLLPLNERIDVFDSKTSDVFTEITRIAGMLEKKKRGPSMTSDPQEVMHAFLVPPTNVEVKAPKDYLWSTVLGPPLCPQVVLSTN